MKVRGRKAQGAGDILEQLARDCAATAIDAVGVENADGRGRFVILCDHASNRFPPEYGSLGLNEAEREAHIAWDPGAFAVSRHLVRALDAPLVYSTVSRLVIDCNRALDAPDLIAAVSETTEIPGNAKIAKAERLRRIALVHAPYHAAIERLIDKRLAGGLDTALVAIHSFTPVYRGVARPWEVSLIFDRDWRLADPLVEELRSEGFKVGVNEPYSPADRVFYTLTRHAESRGLAPAMIEIRNDLVRGERAEATWAERIGRILSSTKDAIEWNAEPVAQAGARRGRT